MDDADKTHKNIAEARDRKIQVLPPDVNESREDFTVVDGKIRFGLGAIKGVGAKASEAILLERDAGGFYCGLDDLARRVRSAHVNRRVLESLVKCGGFDSSGVSRAALLTGSTASCAGRRPRSRAPTSTASSLRPTEGPRALRVPPKSAWTEDELLAAEKETLGFFITAHPLDRFRKHLAKLVTCRTVGLRDLPNQQKVTVAGVVQGLKSRTTRRVIATPPSSSRTARASSR
jgi:DNA polymerase-3 subunit alpha